MHMDDNHLSPTSLPKDNETPHEVPFEIIIEPNVVPRGEINLKELGTIPSPLSNQKQGGEQARRAGEEEKAGAFLKAEPEEQEEVNASTFFLSEDEKPSSPEDDTKPAIQEMSLPTPEKEEPTSFQVAHEEVTRISSNHEEETHVGIPLSLSAESSEKDEQKEEEKPEMEKIKEEEVGGFSGGTVLLPKLKNSFHSPDPSGDPFRNQARVSIQASLNSGIRTLLFVVISLSLISGIAYLFFMYAFPTGYLTKDTSTAKNNSSNLSLSAIPNKQKELSPTTKANQDSHEKNPKKNSSLS
ncbi:MAG: hypothetical protein D6785_00260, partial [Planctomycetota bacterium]